MDLPGRPVNLSFSGPWLSILIFSLFFLTCGDPDVMDGITARAQPQECESY